MLTRAPQRGRGHAPAPDPPSRAAGGWLSDVTRGTWWSRSTATGRRAGTTISGRTAPRRGEARTLDGATYTRSGRAGGEWNTPPRTASPARGLFVFAALVLSADLLLSPLASSAASGLADCQDVAASHPARTRAPSCLGCRPVHAACTVRHAFGALQRVSHGRTISSSVRNGQNPPLLAGWNKPRGEGEA